MRGDHKGPPPSIKNVTLETKLIQIGPYICTKIFLF